METDFLREKTLTTKNGNEIEEHTRVIVFSGDAFSYLRASGFNDAQKTLIHTK